MLCPENLSLLPDSLEWGTDHQGPRDNRGAVVEVPALHHCMDVLPEEGEGASQKPTVPEIQQSV